MKFSSQRIRMLKIEDLKPNPYQIRRKFNAVSLQELASSIKEYGVLMPVMVRATFQGYEIIFGERRVRAAQISGLKTIPAIIIRAGDKQCALLSMAENLHRENLTNFEEGEGFFNLISYHNVKKDSLSKEISLEKSRISSKMRLLSISEQVRYKIEEKNPPEEVVREIAKLPDEEKQLEILEKVTRADKNREFATELVRNSLRETAFCKKGDRKRKINPFLYINTIKQTVEILKSNGAKAELWQNESENELEFTIKILK